MNAESPMGPPTPQPTNAGVIMFIVFIAIVAALVLHYFLKNRGSLMTDHADPYSDDEPRSLEKAETHRLIRNAVTVLGGPMPVPPPESSVNDVHLLREQDQALAQLAVQYEDMVKPPWSYESITQIPDVAAGATPLGRRTQILSAMMTPPSAAASQRGTSARATLWFMNVGANRVAAASDAACKVIHKRINDDYFAIIAEHKAATLQQIVSLAMTPDLAITQPGMHAAKCGQTRVVFSTREQAEGMAEKLNVSYAAIVKPEVDRVLEEIRAEAST